MNQSINEVQLQLARLDLHGGFLITSTAAGAASLIRRLLAPDDVLVVESEVNQTPMERNRDLNEEEEEEEELLPLLVVLRSESGRDHAGLHAQRSCSGVRRPDDEGASAPRRSRPAMLRQTRSVARRGELGRCLLPAAILIRSRARPRPRPAS
jgi:hypothetical protein